MRARTRIWVNYTDLVSRVNLKPAEPFLFDNTGCYMCDLLCGIQVVMG